MNAIVLSVGDELVLGQTVDTNSAWLSRQLAEIGISPIAHMTVPDDQPSIEWAIRQSIDRAPAVLITGGLGPTEDDLTRQALAKVMDVPLELNESWLARLETFFQKLGREMPPSNRIQAMIPHGAMMVENTCGTAAGIHAAVEISNPKSEISDFRSGISGPKSRNIFIMPGVPKEMMAMFTRDIRPVLEQASAGAVILSSTLHTFGLGESTVAQKLGPLMMRQRNPSVGTTVSQGIVSLRINARYGSRDEAQKQLDETIEQCRASLGDVIFGADDETLPHVIANLLHPESAIPSPKSRTVCTAESCTGGWLAKMLTDIPGSSDYFTQGWVTYSNRAKIERLGVSGNLIEVHGAVSEPVADAMARHARRLAKADFALSISGVAGPGGGTPTKPVGTVCIALAWQKDPTARGDDQYRDSNSLVRTFTFTGDREMVRDRSAKMALSMLRYRLLEKPMPF